MLNTSVYLEESIPTQKERFWRHFRSNNLAMFGLWNLGVIALITLFSPLLTPHDPIGQSTVLLQPPSWSQEGSIEYFLGTDDLGRDILSRLLSGSQITIGSALLITIIAATIGCVIGALAGMTKGLISSTLNHLLDTVMSIPSLLLALIFIAFFGTGMVPIMMAICLTLVPRFIRSAYQAIHSEVEKDYIMSAKLDGADKWYLLTVSILPNVLAPIAAEFTFALTVALLDITALGFLGLGAQAPSPEWGAIIGDSVELVYLAPWTVLLPGLAIMYTVITINLVGEGVRDALNAGVE